MYKLAFSKTDFNKNYKFLWNIESIKINLCEYHFRVIHSQDTISFFFFIEC